MFSWFRRRMPEICARISRQIFTDNHLFTQVIESANLQARCLAMHPDKTFIGKVAKGFDFLGFHITPTGVTISAAALSRHEQTVARQGAPAKRIWSHRLRWLAWAGFAAAQAASGVDMPLTTECTTESRSDATVLASPFTGLTGELSIGSYYLYHVTDGLEQGSVSQLLDPYVDGYQPHGYDFVLFGLRATTHPAATSSGTLSGNAETTSQGNCTINTIQLGGGPNGQSCFYSYELWQVNNMYCRQQVASESGTSSSRTCGTTPPDCTSTYRLSISGTTAGAEPGTAGRFTVSVSPANNSGSAITGTVAYSGTAIQGTDYNTAPTTFSIANGASEATFDFAVINDSAVEGTETVIATISNPSTGMIGTAAATANLTDDDVAAGVTTLKVGTKTIDTFQQQVDIIMYPRISKMFDLKNDSGGDVTVSSIVIEETEAPVSGLRKLTDGWQQFSAWSLLGITEVQAVGASDFTLNLTPTLPYTITNGSTYTFTIDFTPTAEGLRDGIVVVTFSDGSVFRFAISGNGTTATPGTPTNIPVFGPLGLLAMLGGLFWFGNRRRRD